MMKCISKNPETWATVGMAIVLLAAVSTVAYSLLQAFHSAGILN